MDVVRETVRLGLAARGQAKLKVRQPLREAVIVAAGAEREAIERLADLVRDELNVKDLRFVSAADELGRYEVKPNYRALGPRFGSLMPQVADAVAALDPPHVAAALREGREIGISLDGHDHTLGPSDLQLAMRPLDGYQLEREGSHAVALDLALDDELRREGLAREIVHAVQSARRSAGLAVEDRIALALTGTRSCSPRPAPTRTTCAARRSRARCPSRPTAARRARPSTGSSSGSRSRGPSPFSPPLAGPRVAVPSTASPASAPGTATYGLGGRSQASARAGSSSAWSLAFG